MTPESISEIVPAATRERLGLPAVGQIGYVVADIAKTVAYCREAFGIAPWLVLDQRPDPCMQGKEPAHPLLAIGLAYAGSMQIELIQVKEGDSIHLRHLQEPESRIHHLGFMVQDLDRRLRDYERMGIGILQQGTIRNAGITVKYAYLDVADTAGIIVELIQWRLGPFPLPTSRLVFGIACMLGARTVFKGRVTR
jgi:catechol 2,3-dioxygenase-like lactoylglutathione lyase family enzyme